MRTHTKKRPLEIIAFFQYTQKEYFQMIKLSASANDRDETVRSDLSRGGYVTSDEKLELSNYLVNLPSQNDFIMEIDV